jgi:hypothetical protein
MEAMAPLIGENLGMQRMPLDFSSEDGRHRLDLGDGGHIEVQDIVPFGVETGEPVHMVGVFHPAGSDLAVAKAGDSRLTVFGMEPELAGKAGFSAPFAWSA